MKFVPLHLKLFAASVLSAMRRRMAGARTRALLVESEQGLLLVEPGDLRVGRMLSSEGAYGADELTRLSSLVDAQSDVLMLGGHIGALAIPLAKRCRSLTVVEASPATFRLLELNLLINRIQNVRTLNLACSDKHEQLDFLASPANSGGSKRLPKLPKYMYSYDRPATITVRAAPLDDVFPDSTFDLITMDIEGSEYFALRGMPRLLARARHLVVEFIPHHLTNVAGVSVAEFVDLIDPFFDCLFIPSKNLTVEKVQFRSILQTMFERDEIDEELIFSRE